MLEKKKFIKIISFLYNHVSPSRYRKVSTLLSNKLKSKILNKISQIINCHFLQYRPNFLAQARTENRYRVWPLQIIYDSVGSEALRKNACKLGDATFTCMHASSWFLRSVA